MENYAVKKLAKIAGVSVRTLHLYDQMGLLIPSVRTEARYRLYGQKELLRLQQILFYRELDFPLKEIGEILDDPDFNLTQALENHKVSLYEKSKRINTLIETIDKTLDHLKNKTMLPVEELYDGLSMEHREQAMQKWGKDRVLKGEEYLRNLDKEQLNAMKKELNDIMTALANSVDKDPEGREVQALIERHHEMIVQFSGAGNQEYIRSKAYYKGLGELYEADDRYTQGNAAFAAFAKKAMHHYADSRLI